MTAQTSSSYVVYIYNQNYYQIVEIIKFNSFQHVVDTFATVLVTIFPCAVNQMTGNDKICCIQKALYYYHAVVRRIWICFCELLPDKTTLYTKYYPLLHLY